MIIHVIDENQNKNLKFMEFGKPSPTRERGWGPGVRDYYTLHVVLSGEGFFNGKLLKKGDFFVTLPYQKIHYYPNPENPWNYIWVLLKGDEVPAFLSSYNLFPESGFGPFGDVDEITQVSNVLFVQNFDTIKASTALNLTKFFFSFTEKEQSNPNGNVKQQHLENATNFIESHYHEGISPKSVADFVGLDEKYLYSLFKSYLKISLQEYLNNLRIEKSKVLLEKNDLNISEIAYSIGIEDPLNFSRFFKKRVGLSPKAFRKKCLNENN